MRLNFKSIVIILAGLLALAFAIKAIKSSGSLSADMNSQSEQLENAVNN